MLWLPAPPGTNRIWVAIRVGPGARMVRRGTYVQWRKVARRLVEAWWGDRPMFPAGRPYRLEPLLAVRIRAGLDFQSDLDGVVKPVLDVMEGIVFADDRTVCRLDVARKVGIDRAVEVQIEEIEDEPGEEEGDLTIIPIRPVVGDENPMWWVRREEELLGRICAAGDDGTMVSVWGPDGKYIARYGSRERALDRLR